MADTVRGKLQRFDGGGQFYFVTFGHYSVPSLFFSLSRTGSKLITPDDPVFKEGRSSAIRVGREKSLWNLRNGYKKEKSRQNGAPRAWRTLRAVSQIGTLQFFFNYYRWKEKKKRYWKK